MPTNRIITDEQFAPGTAIDGDRMDRAFQGIQDAVNEVGPGNVVRRHFASHFVAGYQPDIFPPVGAVADGSAPFYSSYNQVANIPAPGLPPGSTISNPYRVKGQFNPGIDPTDPAPTPNEGQYIWTQMYSFTDSVILSAVSCWMFADSAYVNTFEYGAGTPGHDSLGSVNDFLLEIDVASPASPEDTLKGAVAYHKLHVKASWEVSNTHAPASTHGDMQPPHPAGFAYAKLAIVDTNLNVPIPRDSRVRFSLLIPKYSAGAGAWRQAEDFFRGQTYNLDMVVLEPTK